MKKIALTGNMGSGKSYVGHLIARFGVFVLDIDEVAKQVREEQESEIIKMFALSDPKALATLIFNDSHKREQLEQFLYTYMLEKMDAFFTEHQEEKISVVEVPLLFEKGWEQYFDEVWCVSCSSHTAMQRLKKYRHIDEDVYRKRLAQQMNNKEKEAKSTHIIYNNEEDDVLKQISKLLKKEGYNVEKG